MKRLLGLLISAALIAGSGGTALAQGVKKDLKEAGKDSKKAAKATGRKVKKTSRKAANRGAKATSKGANKVQNKTK
jgi:hypothetical protein